MSDRPQDGHSSPDATVQVSQEHDKGGDVRRGGAVGSSENGWLLGPGIARAASVRPYDRRRDDPIYRPLRVYTLDPSQPKLEGAVAVVNVPYEPLEPGPVGRLFEVDNTDGERGVRYASVDLDDPKTIVRSGRDPSPSDPRFHQQMVYAVSSTVYAAFKAALGRDVPWGFDRAGPPLKDDGTPGRLRLRLVPHGMVDENAYYSRTNGEVRFGYYQAPDNIDAKNPPNGWVFTCLSHDIVAHEVSHALLDGLRPYFLVPMRSDVLAFHEAFGDLVAIFQHFAYRDIVAAALRRWGTRLDRAQIVGGLATQFGYTTQSRGTLRPLRSAIDIPEEGAAPRRYKPDLEIHQLGSVLVSAVFEAFCTLFQRKAERYLRLAGTTSVETWPSVLHDMLATEASQLASQILNLCIRAIDYCPPVDLEFGDYLRAMITADSDLVPDDPWAYREALIDAFGRRGIFPRNVRNLAEDSLQWRPPPRTLEIERLHYARLHFAGDPALAADPAELRDQANALGSFVTQEANLQLFGLAKPDGTRVRKPTIESIRTARRVGPDGQVLFDLIAEIVQEIRLPGGDEQMVLYGGSTVIVGPDGVVRYAVLKSVTNERRHAECREFAATRDGRALWATRGEQGTWGDVLQRVHAGRRAASDEPKKRPAESGVVYFARDADPAYVAALTKAIEKR